MPPFLQALSARVRGLSFMAKFLDHGKGGELLLRVNVKPGARQTQVVGESEGALSVQVAAPPREGECNKALLEFVAELRKRRLTAVHLKKSQVSLAHGHKSRDKVVALSGIAMDDAAKMLRDCVDHPP